MHPERSYAIRMSAPEKEVNMPGGTEPEILTKSYQSTVNIAIWETGLSTKLESAVKAVMDSSPGLQLSEVISISLPRISSEDFWVWTLS